MLSIFTRCLFAAAVIQSPTEIKIETSELIEWNKAAIDLVQHFALDDGDGARVFAYLYTAQKTFADASLALTEEYLGSVGPISLQTLRLFEKSFRSKLKADDAFSKDLTQLVARQIDDRFKNEQAEIHAVPMRKGDNIWQGKIPYSGMKIPSMKPWLLSEPSQFRSPAPPPPNDPFWQDQLALVKDAMAQATDAQKKQILFWAGLAGVDSGDWKTIAEKYMDQNQTPLGKRLEVRTLLSLGMFDALVATFDTKYTFWVKRPFMLDPQLKTYIVTPNFPSYPAAHSTVGKTAAIILTYYFPENEQEWNRLADEMGLSRIWAGVHFPIDHEAGQALGEKVGSLALLNAGKVNP